MAVDSKPLHIPSTARALPKHWRWDRLDEVCEGVFDCPHSTPILTDAGPFVVRSQDVRTGVFRMEQAGHVSDETYQERIARSEPQFGDLVYSREGTYFGNAAEVPPDVQVCLGQRMVLMRPNEQKANFRFLRFWLNSPVMARHIHGHRDGTVAERLNMPTIRALPVALPPLDEQDAIAQVLGALDDKIELNRRMNETLEALAQTIFKSRFVVAAATKLPKGWRTGTLSDLVELRADRVEATPAKDSERYIALEDMPSKSIDLSSHQYGSAVNSSIIKFQHGDILFGSMRPYFHKVGLAAFDGITRTTTFVLRPKRDNFRNFALFHFFSKEVVEFATTASVGTTIPYVKWESLKSYEIPIPPDSLLDEFENAACPLVQRITANGHESRTLAELRDALLPKLLSGKLRVPATGKEANK
jgi:type I restriction enzyme S subunit